MASNKGFSLKDQLINIEKVRHVAGLFYAADPDFDAEGFENEVMESLLDLELKARMNLISEVLERHLPDDFEDAAERILLALPPPLDPTKTDNDFGLFIYGSFGEYVVRNGLDSFPVALPLLKEITKRSTMELAIRHFLNTDAEAVLQAMAEWVEDDNYHVRRLVSEGTRPTLPWGLKVGLSLTDPLPFLDILHADNTRFVTRSVANHLNDISKKDPALVLETLSRWHEAGLQNPKELDWMTRHALRTLVKRGNPQALAMLGYHAEPEISVSPINILPKSAKVQIGDTAEFSFTILAEKDENLMIDYVIDFVKSNGSTSPKVFKIKKLPMKKGQSVSITKSHRFLKDATTFTHYAGDHKMTLQINGKNFGECHFTLN